MTKAEKAMWGILKDFNAQGASFRRETPIGAFIADFAWLSRRFVIEVDDDSHETIDGKNGTHLKTLSSKNAVSPLCALTIIRLPTDQILSR
jgi:very-short-patch-repair endonuclease